MPQKKIWGKKQKKQNYGAMTPPSPPKKPLKNNQIWDGRVGWGGCTFK
jgi:hypothetical protein